MAIKIFTGLIARCKKCFNKVHAGSVGYNTCRLLIESPIYVLEQHARRRCGVPSMLSREKCRRIHHHFLASSNFEDPVQLNCLKALSLHPSDSEEQVSGRAGHKGHHH